MSSCSILKLFPGVAELPRGDLVHVVEPELPGRVDREPPGSFRTSVGTCHVSDDDGRLRSC